MIMLHIYMHMHLCYVYACDMFFDEYVPHMCIGTCLACLNLLLLPVSFERAVLFNRIAREILVPMGWVEIDWQLLTAARAYDSTDHNDGMHAAPNTLRMLVQVIYGSKNLLPVI